MRYLLPVLLVFLSHSLFSQEDTIPKARELDTSLRAQKIKNKLSDNKKQQEPEPINIKDYKIISFARDTTFLDTTLTIEKEYKYNYLRKDDFELMPFANVGQPYNRLGVSFESEPLYPSLGASAKHFNYMEVEDIDYYNVPTPLTDLMFKTTFDQGQLLDAMLTFNTSERMNFSIAYKGFRSLGKYQSNEAESGNFRTTANYVSKNNRYRIRAHIAAQDILTEENGGIIAKDLQFESGDPEFTDRSRLDVAFSDANNKVLGKRYFFEHQYKLVKKEKDSSSSRATSLALGHQFNYETKYYQFKQDQQNDYFGDVFLGPIDDKANLKTAFNQFSIEFSNNTLGNLKGLISLYNYNYYFNSLLITDTQEIQNKLKGEEIMVGADYTKQIGGFKVAGGIRYNVSGNLTENLLNASASYMINEKNKLKFCVHSSSRMPDFNFLLYQSDYQNYNWQNTSSFENQKVNSLEFNFDSQVLGKLSARYTTLDNYTYFKSEATPVEIDLGQENAFIKPFQEGNSVNLIKVKYMKELRLGNFALNNTVMYQNVSQTNNVLNLPQLVTRNTLYFSKDVFKRAMYIQTGVTFKYFTSYNMDAYNPLLGEFYSQNREELGGFPMLDFFINAKIKQTRIYLKAEHINSSFTGYEFYAAPNYPYRDFVIRFGLVWNFFS